MDLKNTIDNTSKCKNDLKLARNKINDKIVSGGGTIADTISDVPRAIDAMLKGNYKKIAYIEPNIGINQNGWYLVKPVTKGTVITLPLNLDFNPREIYFGIGLYNRNAKTCKIITKVGEYIEIFNNISESFSFEVIDFSSEKITLKCVGLSSSSERIYLSTTLAIE